MTGKQNAVFWMGLTLIVLNFWITGQSATFWGAFTKPSGSTGTAGGPAPGVKPGALGPKGTRLL